MLTRLGKEYKGMVYEVFVYACTSKRKNAKRVSINRTLFTDDGKGAKCITEINEGSKNAIKFHLKNLYKQGYKDYRLSVRLHGTILHNDSILLSRENLVDKLEKFAELLNLHCYNNSVNR